MRHPRILSAILGEPWAIWPPAMENILAILDRNSDSAEFEALAARVGKPLENTGNRVEMRGSTAIVAVDGPIFRYANVFTMISGATSVELLAQDFEAALSNPAVDRIVMTFDTPGGEVAGISALAEQIREGATRKPVIAYVEKAASAGYWLASAAPKVIADKAAWAGSLGVIATMSDNRAAQERQGVTRYEIISSQSPFKRPDPATEQGMSQLQAMVDEMAQQFIDAVAGFRGVTAADVLDRFGQGRMVSAFVSKERGMIDGIQAYEPFLASLTESNRSFVSFAAAAAQEVPMHDPTQAAANGSTALVPATDTAAAASAAAVTAAVKADRARSAAIHALPEAQGRELLARTLAHDTDLTVEQAKAILTASPQAQPAPSQNGFQLAMGQLRNPIVGADGGAGEDTPQAEADRVLAFVPNHRKVKRAS